jgi:hypothetical protein
MPFVRRRTAKSGSISTALVEAYRDESGRPRQRILANLHGEPDTLRALAKLKYQQADLRKHRDSQWAEVQASNEYEPDFVAEYFAELDADLAAIDKEISTLEKHCRATPGKIRAAIREHEEALNNVVVVAMGSLLDAWGRQDAHKAAKAALRRLRR